MHKLGKLYFYTLNADAGFMSEPFDKNKVYLLLSAEPLKETFHSSYPIIEYRFLVKNKIIKIRLGTDKFNVHFKEAVLC